MGKIRIKTLGDEEVEQAEKQQAKKRAEAKSASGGKKAKIHLPGMGGGQRIAVVGPTEEELERLGVSENLSDSVVTREISDSQITNEKPETTETPADAKAMAGRQKITEAQKRKKSKFAKTKKRSANYTAKVMGIDKNKTYPLADALQLLKKINTAKFDETVELHINTTEPGISGQVKLPHGTGKEIKVAIANDQVLEEVEKGKVNFDVLIAEPGVMPRLAKVAKILGPRGLMPNPKNGTISENPEEAMKKFQGGQVSFKTESKIPVMHLSVGKTSFQDSQLKDNIQTIIEAVKKDRIRKIVLKSTMSPAIKLAV